MNMKPIFTPTGVGLCVMDHTGNVLETFYGQDGKGIVGNLRAWDYELLQQLFPHQDAVYALFQLYDGSIEREVLGKVLKTSIGMQSGYVATGDPGSCGMMKLQEVANRTGCDPEVAFKSLQSVKVVTQRHTFALGQRLENQV